jgi:hypothetical protein
MSQVAAGCRSGLSSKLLAELGTILQEELGIRLSGNNLKEFAQALLSYYGILLEVKERDEQ